jgi:hypothetical protein
MQGGSTVPKGALLVRRSGRDVSRVVPATMNVLWLPYVLPDIACHQKSRRRERYAEEVGPSGRWQLLLRRQ